MSVKKRFPIALDVKRSTSLREIEVVEGDNGNVLEITLTDDDTAVDLTDCLVCAMFAKPNGGTAQQDNNGHGIVMDETENNKFKIELYTTSFSPGLVECEVQVYSGERHDILITTAKFNFSCRGGIVNAQTIPATDAYPLLVDLMQRCANMEDAETVLEASEAERNQAEQERLAAEAEREAVHQKLENLSVTATQLPIGNMPTASAQFMENGLELAFGLIPGNPAEPHAAAHAAGGNDVLTPDSIGAAPAAVEIQGVILANAWEEQLATVTGLTGITADTKGIIGLPETATKAQREAAREAMLTLTGKGAGSITITADGSVPSVDIPFVITKVA